MWPVHRLFAFHAVVRFTEFTLLTVNLAYLNLLAVFDRLLVLILVSAVLNAMYSLAVYLVGHSLLASAITATATTTIDVAVLALSILGAPSLVSVYMVGFVNALIDVVTIMILLESGRASVRLV